MAKAAIVLAFVAVLGVVVNLGVGIATGAGWLTVRAHFNAAIPSTIVVLAAWTIVIFYFIGARAWVEEAVSEGRAEPSLDDAAKSVRGHAIPGPIAAAAALSVTYVVGGGAHSGAVPWPVHFALALLTLALHLWAMYRTIVFVGMMLDLQAKVAVVES